MMRNLFIVRTIVVLSILQGGCYRGDTRVAERAAVATGAGSPIASGSPRFGASKEWLVVLIGDSQCGASTVPGLPEAIAGIRGKLRTHASDNNGRLVSIGVSLDWNLEDGLGFLEHFGPFDEIVVGGNWLGQGATRWIWRDIRGPAALPQLIVLRREVETLERTISIGPDVELIRLVGANRILEWSSRGNLDLPADTATRIH